MLELVERPVSPAACRMWERLRSAPRDSIYVLGRNRYAATVARVLPVAGFIDDYTQEQRHLDRPVLRVAEAPADALVVSCVVEGRPVSAMRRLQSAGLAAVDYFALTRLAPDAFPPVAFCRHNRREILTHAAEHAWMYAQLADEQSRDTFARVTRFRLNFDLASMEGFELALDRQYFEPFVPLHPGGVFVDGGGFDGQTSLEYARRAPDYARIHFFEPAAGAMATARVRLSGLRHIDFHLQGLGAAPGRARFDASHGPASAFAADGSTEVEVTSLDAAVSEPISFLKLDVEGAEDSALAGAERHLRDEPVALAVCVYHDQRDFWRIGRRVLSLRPEYRTYVRHYTEGVFETVMFFIPPA